MIIHIQPSWFVKMARVYLAWCPVTVCEECNQTAKYEDAHTVNPCTNCGSRVIQRVGRWIKAKKPWYQLWTNKGHWEIKMKKK